MKKGLIFLSCIFIVITLIVILIKKDIKKEEKIEEITIEEKQEIEYKANQTILVKLTKNNEIVAMDMNDYLRGVVASEMPGTYEVEALKAQALVARTYTYNKMINNSELEFDVTDSYLDCQAFHTKEKIFEIWKNKGESEELIQEKWSKINEAVCFTNNQVITYDNELIRAYFHASSPVKTENIDQIWGKQYFPYLQSVDNFEDENYRNRYSCLSISYSELENKIIDNVDCNFKFINYDIEINEYTTSNRIKDVKFDNLIISAEKLRVILGLKSTLFDITIEENQVVFNVTGYGHGIGMSQVGANYLACNGESYIDIVKYYYKGVEIKEY